MQVGLSSRYSFFAAFQPTEHIFEVTQIFPLGLHRPIKHGLVKKTINNSGLKKNASS
jgi:hypothetical protein